MLKKTDPIQNARACGEKTRLHAFQEELASLLRRHKNQDGKSDLVMTFKGGATTKARELSVFLDLFTVAYNVCIVAFNYAKEFSEPMEIDGNLINRALMEVSELDGKDRFIDLEIERITFQSRLAISFTGVTIALTLAVNLSGAEAEVEPRGLSAQMDTLGKSIGSLKNALNDE
jgi:hypothetical protein